VPFHLGHHAPLSVPTSSPITEASSYFVPIIKASCYRDSSRSMIARVFLEVPISILYLRGNLMGWIMYNLKLLVLISTVMITFFAGGKLVSANVAYVTSVVNQGKGELEACRVVAKPQRFSCVADALSTVDILLASNLHYSKAAQIIFKSSKAIRATTKLKVAFAAIAVAKKLLLRTTGLRPPHNTILAGLMDTARSVLRR